MNAIEAKPETDRMSLRRDSDRLLQRIRTLIRDRQRGLAKGELEARGRETERLERDPAASRRTALTEGEKP